MKKNVLRIIMLIVATALAVSAFAGCLMGGNMKTPKVTDEEEGVETAYEDRRLSFVTNTASAQVNVDTPLGFFCYEDNQFRILTENSGTEEHDDSISYSLIVYDGEKNADGSNRASDDKYTYGIKENGYLYLKSQVLGTVEIDASCANGSSIEVRDVAVVPHSLKFFDIIIGAIGLYLLYSAIIGKGKLFQNDFVKEGMEQKHKAIVRITSLVIGILMLAAVAIALFDKYGRYRIATLVTFGMVLIVFIVSTVLLRRCTDMDAKRKAMNDRYAGGGARKTPAAAFVFDENEPTVDDIRKREQ